MKVSNSIHASNQACRGQEYNRPVKTRHQSDGGTESSSVVEDWVPDRSDMMFCFSTADSHFAVRHPTYGSLYIQTVVDCLRKYAPPASPCQLDWDTLFTCVNERVSREIRLLNDEKHMQMPVFHSLLRGKLILPGPPPSRLQQEQQHPLDEQ